MPTYGLTDNGLRIKTLFEILNELEIDLKSSLGEEFVLDPENDDFAKVISAFGERLALLWELNQAVNDSQIPSGAEGTNLDDVCELTGVTRLEATKSSCSVADGNPVTCTGTIGITIPAGSIVSVEGTGAKFVSLSDALIPAGGTIDVDFEAQEAGATQAPASTLTVIETPVSDWSSATNSSGDATVGRATETDTELRIRRETSLQILGGATIDAIRARLINEVSGVSDALVFENDSRYVDAQGRPSKSIHCVVVGGSDSDVAEKIWDVKGGGIYTFGIGLGSASQATINSIANIGSGRVRITTAAAHGFSAGAGWTVVQDTSPNDYDGGFEILNIFSTTKYDIEAAFTTTATGTAIPSIPDVSEPVTDDSGNSHTIRFDRANEIAVWMHVTLSVDTGFNQGNKQVDVIEVKNAIDSETYTVSINGIDFSYTATVPADDETVIASALITAIETHDPNGWVPVKATASGPADEFINLEADYDGVAYDLSVSATGTGDIEVLSGSHIDAAGDQAAVISNIIDFADGTELLAAEQTIGREIYRSRYNNPINDASPNITSISIQIANVTSKDTDPLNAPGGADWDAADYVIDTTERANIDTFRTSVEIV